MLAPPNLMNPYTLGAMKSIDNQLGDFTCYNNL